MPRDPILDILPPPFAWIEIPAGEVTVEAGGYVSEGGQTFQVARFAIAKFPVTNGQYEVFANDRDGFANKGWWDYSAEAIAWREIYPYPEAPLFDSASDHPRAKVAWFDAVGFCRWLSAKVGYEVRLPTEQEWQRAAQGNDGRTYPWGEQKPDNTLCNWHNSITTPVDYYPQGVSPYGVMDLAGNEFEWCLNDYESGATNIDEPAKYRMLRGGCFGDLDESFLRVANREGEDPRVDESDFGFRLARSSLSAYHS